MFKRFFGLTFAKAEINIGVLWPELMVQQFGIIWRFFKKYSESRKPNNSQIVKILACVYFILM